MPVRNGVASYKTDECLITFRFQKGSVVVTQDLAAGSCDFGANVTADGTYLYQKGGAGK